MRHTRTILCLGLSVAMFVAHAVAQSDQGLIGRQGRKLLRRQTTLPHADQITIEAAFREALSYTKVPGGIILAANCGEESKYQLNMSSKSLQEVLDSMTSADPSYKWTLEDGVVNLAPAKGGPMLLNLRVAKFDVEKANSLVQAASELLDLPEVKQGMAELHINDIRQELGGSSMKKPGFSTDESEHGFTVSCEDVTLKQALNAIVRAHGSGVWAYSERHCGGRDDVRLDFIVR